MWPVVTDSGVSASDLTDSSSSNNNYSHSKQLPSIQGTEIGSEDLIRCNKNLRAKNKEKRIRLCLCLPDVLLTSMPSFHVFLLLVRKSHLLPCLLTLQLRQRSS